MDKVTTAGMDFRTSKNSSSASNRLLVTSIFVIERHSVRCEMDAGELRALWEKLIVCSIGQQDKFSIVERRLLDKSRMVRLANVFNPSTYIQIAN